MIDSSPSRWRSPGVRAALVLLVLALLAARPGSGYMLIRSAGFSIPPAFWPMGNLPLPMLINSAGSDNVPGSSDTNAIIAGQAAWGAINTAYFVFAAPVVGTGTALNGTDGKNSVFFDETGANFGAGNSAIAFTQLNINGTTGVISDTDLLFNGTLTFSTATPTPAGAFDIQSIATHELGHVTGLDHSGLINAVMFPIGADGTQFMRNLSSDDRLAESFVYPESAAGTGLAALATGEGDLAQGAGVLTGSVTAGVMPVPGAHVVALDANGSAVVSDLSHPDGTYALTGLAPGNYQVYAEPLDGVTIEQDLLMSNFMNVFGSFQTVFLGGNGSPTTVAISAGAVAPGNTINLGPVTIAEVEANNTAGAANPVLTGERHSGVANPAADVDYYSFSAATGDIVQIDADGSGDGWPLDPVLTLFSTDGTTQLVQIDDFLGKGNDCRIARSMPATGTFSFRVEDFSNLPGGPVPVGGEGYFYSVRMRKAVLEVETNNTLATANAAAIGQLRGGIIATSGDLDWYSFTAGFGDRIIAEITANRPGAGSTLNPTLTLFRADSVQLAQSTDINGGAGNRDSLIDFTFAGASVGTLPATFYLRVSAASGAGATAFYALDIATDAPNLYYSGIAPTGSGVTGAGLDIFPKFVSQGSNFDLLVAGTGLPPDITDNLTIPGPGVTLGPSAGSDFGAIGGLYDPSANPLSYVDFFAYTATLSPTAPPGPRTVFFNGPSAMAALSGGLIITPTSVPAEAGPLTWSPTQISFPPDPAAVTYNLYRGNLPLVDANLNGVADSYGSALACGLTAPIAADTALPTPGNGFFYLVTARNLNGEGSLGFTRSNAGPGPARPIGAISPVCP